jgi:HSP20 family protein
MALSNLLPSRRRRGALTRRGEDWPEMSSLKQEIDRVFDDFFSGFDLSPFREMDERLERFAPSIDVSETSKEIKVTAELPGMEEKDISISLEDDFLLIKGERKEEKKKRTRNTIIGKCPTVPSGGWFRWTPRSMPTR